MNTKLSEVNVRTWKDPSVRQKRLRWISKGQKKYFSLLSKKKKHCRLKNWMNAGREAARFSTTRSSSLKKYWASLASLEKLKRCKNWSIAGIKAASSKWSNTSIELCLQKVLRDAGIKMILQKYVGAVSIDIFVKPNTCIFADGVYWHNLPHRKTRDKKVNKTLKENGYDVIRFPERMINEYPDLCVETVLDTLKNRRV